METSNFKYTLEDVDKIVGLETKRKSRSVYRAIKTLVPVIGDSFLSLMDKE